MRSWLWSCSRHIGHGTRTLHALRDLPCHELLRLRMANDLAVSPSSGAPTSAPAAASSSGSAAATAAVSLLARADQLAGGKTRSCGCAWRAALRATLVARNHRHGGYGSRLYRIWAILRERCNSPRSRDYKNFGARGVSVCEAWNDFSGFRAWALDNGYADNLSVALIDRAGNFEPANCRWARSHNYRPPKKHLVESRAHECRGSHPCATRQASDRKRIRTKGRTSDNVSIINWAGFWRNRRPGMKVQLRQRLDF